MTISDTRLKKSAKATTLLKVWRSTEDVQGQRFAAEAALRSARLFHYLAGGLRLFGAGEFW